jgi:hypothetical protein
MLKITSSSKKIDQAAGSGIVAANLLRDIGDAARTPDLKAVAGVSLMIFEIVKVSTNIVPVLACLAINGRK